MPPQSSLRRGERWPLASEGCALLSGRRRAAQEGTMKRGDGAVRRAIGDMRG